ncbi:acyl carrier protein [Burkholderia ubonensis]|uniref:acyl carrier protein n=1 Tax=Burkholderia ubonensis TaxID=101571 RepID=UPI00075BC4E1|nr:acyl carrier protein [Burkholderia ubonensis]KVT72964.1 hypothetical protein WK54_03450 [Burkholderia ubonensis]
MTDVLEQQVKTVMMAHLLVDEAQLLQDTSLVDQLYLDSLDLLDLVLALNHHFDIEIGTDEIVGIKTVADLCQVVGRLLPHRRNGMSVD